MAEGPQTQSVLEPPAALIQDAAAGPLRYASAPLDEDEAAHHVVSCVPMGASVLDVGCGIGTIAAHLRDQRDANVVGIEPSRERAAEAEMRGIHTICGPFTRDVARSLGAFDVIVFADVIEHLADPTEAISTAKEMLEPGGAIIASVPNAAHWTIRFKLLFGRFEYENSGILDATHLRWFTRESLMRLFEKLGFSVVSVNYSLGTWMKEYDRWPWRLLHPWRLRKVLHVLVRRWPGLFACQFIVMARPRTDREPPNGNPLA